MTRDEAKKEPPFDRTTCACAECVKCCYRQPGPLAPGDFERIAERLGETRDEAKRHFWASPGALVKVAGTVHRVGTITPRKRHGRCVFLDENDRCKIHDVAPVGCAYFDMHMGAADGNARSLWLIARQADSDEYQAFRNELPYATSYKPNKFQ